MSNSQSHANIVIVIVIIAIVTAWRKGQRSPRTRQSPQPMPKTPMLVSARLGAMIAATTMAEGGGRAGVEGAEVVAERFHEGEAGGYDAEVDFEAVWYGEGRRGLAIRGYDGEGEAQEGGFGGKRVRGSGVR